MTTEAGRALLALMREQGYRELPARVLDLVAAIEAEAFNDGVLAERAVAFDAVTKERERIAAEVRALDLDALNPEINRAEVLAAITERSTPE